MILCCSLSGFLGIIDVGRWMAVFLVSLFSFCRQVENSGFFYYADKNVGTLEVYLSKLRPFY